MTVAKAVWSCIFFFLSEYSREYQILMVDESKEHRVLNHVLAWAGFQEEWERKGV